MASPIVEIVELVAKEASKQGQITYYQKDNIDLSQARRIANIITNFAISRNPDWGVFFNWKVVTDGNEKTIAFGVATESQPTILPLPDADVAIRELSLLVAALAIQEVIDPVELVHTFFPDVEDLRLVELLVDARTTFLHLLGGKSVIADLRVLIDGQVVGEFLTRFPSAQRLEPDPLPKVLIGKILALRENSLEFQDETNGKFIVDFNPTKFFNYLKNRFLIPSFKIQLSTEGEVDCTTVALNSIDKPAIGAFDDEPPQLFP